MLGSGLYQSRNDSFLPDTYHGAASEVLSPADFGLVVSKSYLYRDTRESTVDPLDPNVYWKHIQITWRPPVGTCAALPLSRTWHIVYAQITYRPLVASCLARFWLIAGCVMPCSIPSDHLCQALLNPFRSLGCFTPHLAGYSSRPREISMNW